MLSSDREILIEIQGEVRSLNQRVTKLEQGVQVLQENQQTIFNQIAILTDRIEGLQTSVYWVLAAIGIFLAGITIIPSVISLFRKPEPKSNDKIELTFSQFLDIWMRGENHSSKPEK